MLWGPHCKIVECERQIFTYLSSYLLIKTNQQYFLYFQNIFFIFSHFLLADFNSFNMSFTCIFSTNTRPWIHGGWSSSVFGYLTTRVRLWTSVSMTMTWGRTISWAGLWPLWSCWKEDILLDNEHTLFLFMHIWKCIRVEGICLRSICLCTLQLLYCRLAALLHQSL